MMGVRLTPVILSAVSAESQDLTQRPSHVSWMLPTMRSMSESGCAQDDASVVWCLLRHLAFCRDSLASCDVPCACVRAYPW